MTNKQILELAKTCGFDEFGAEKDDKTATVYWEAWEEQLLKFALLMHKNGYNQGYNSGNTGVFGKPLG